MSVRKLAAIVFTDIVGYTSLMGSDEDQAFEVLRKNREIHTKFIKQFHGTLIKEMGDGMLISFDLASEAVRCAIEIQKSCKAEDIPLKIGIHEAEMVFEGNDVLGDGVNIAFRIQDGAKEGCILISGSVYRDIKNKADIQTEFVEEKQFKNVDEKIRIYRVNCGEETSNSNIRFNNRSQNSDSKKRKVIKGVIGLFTVVVISLLVWQLYPDEQTTEIKKSIAFHPLKYLSEDQNKEHLAYGIRNAINGHLTKIDCLIVRPLLSVDRFQDTNNTHVIGEELDVSYLITGTLYVDKNQAKLTLQITSVRDNKQIFHDEYQLELSDIMQVESKVALVIAKEIGVAISPETRAIIETDPTTDITAYDYYMRGKDFAERTWLKDDLTWWQKLQKAEEMYELAVEMDSVFVLAWVGLANIHLTMFRNQSKHWFHPRYFNYSKEAYLKDMQPQIQKIKGFLDKASALEPDMLEVNLAEARYYRVCLNDLTKAISIREKLLIQYPNDERPVRSIAFELQWKGEYQKSLTYFRKALSLNSTDWSLWQGAGNILEMLRRYDEAVEYYNKAALLDASRKDFSNNIFNIYKDRRQISKAKHYLEEHQEILNEDEIKRYNRRLLWAEGYFEEAIREWEISPIDTTTYSRGILGYANLGRRYIHIGQKEKAAEYYRKAKDIFENLPNEMKYPGIYAKYGTTLAGLGMTTEALDTINKVIEVLGFRSQSKEDWLDVHKEKILILAMSGDHDALFDQMIYILDRYGGRVPIEEFKCNPSQVKCDPFWSQFNKYERFQEIINNPKYQEVPPMK